MQGNIISKGLLMAAMLVLFTTTVFAQKQEKQYKQQTNYKLEAGAYISKDNSAPFWMLNNQHGIVPNKNCGIAQLLINSEFKPESKKLQFIYGADLVAYTGNNDEKAIISQLYGSLKWKNVQLDLGVKHRPTKYQGLSSSNGNILWSNNSRSLPGYCLKLADFQGISFMPKWLSFKLEYGDYILNDDRYMGNRTRLHHKNFFMKTRLSDGLSIITGLDHYCMWAGESEKRGIQPHGIKDYIRVITGSSGGDDALATDKINAIGNHIGAWSIRLEHKGNTDWTFFYSHPFEDRSGREFKNYPDGNYGIYVNRKKEKSFINHFLYEFTYTMHQSGPRHERKLPDGSRDILGGNDSYFNNGVYNSGYTYFNQIMGTPFITPKAINANGMALGTDNNRVIAHHMGIKGHLFDFLPYKLVCSYTRNYGQHRIHFNPTQKNFHALLEVEFKQNVLPFSIVGGCGYSRYSERGEDLGGYVKIVKQGIF